MPAFSFTAPYISEEEEAAERQALTEAERRELQNDLFGVSAENNLEHETEVLAETEESRENALRLFDAALNQISPEDKTHYLDAVQHVPNLVALESNSLALLRLEKFNAWAAARRLVDYWRQRTETFGRERGFLPMTLDGAMKDDLKYFERGVIRLLQDDLHGRPVLFVDRIRAISPVITRESLWRCFFYLMQVIGERDISREGMVVLVNGRGYDLYQHYDRILVRGMIKVGAVFKIKANAIHICTGSGASVVGLVLPVTKHMLGKVMRLRIVVHAGSDLEILSRFVLYGLGQEHLRALVKSALNQDDMRDWIEERCQEERRHRFER